MAKRKDFDVLTGLSKKCQKIYSKRQWCGIMYSRWIEKGLTFTFIFSTLNFIVLLSYIAFLFFDVVECFKYKTLQINIKNEKSICIPIENWKKDKKILQNFIDDLTNESSKIKVRESINRNKKIKILIYIISLILPFSSKNIDNIFITIGIILIVSIPFFLLNIDFEEIERKIEKNFAKFIAICCAILIIATIIPFIPFVPSLINRINYEVKSNKEKENKQLIIDKKCYTEVNVIRAILKESKRLDNSHFKNTYTIKDSGEEIEFEETYFTRHLNN